MEIRKKELGDTWEIYLEGKMLYVDKDKFKDVTFSFAKENITKIILDFEKLEYIDSNGLGMLIVLHGNAQKHGGQIIIRNLNNHVKVLFEQSQLYKLFTIE